jgi:N-acetyl-anhydromuramyl-L-alanine amidase AmpD
MYSGTRVQISPANYTPGPFDKIAITNHVMLGTMGGTLAHFRDPLAQVSANYGLSKSGEVVCYVEEEEMAYANGPIRSPNRGVIADAVLIGNPNKRTISIEWEGTHSGGLWVPSGIGGIATLSKKVAVRWFVPPPDQLAAGIALIRAICARWNIPRDRAHIGRHSDIDSVTKWFCPGGGFPLQTILDSLRDYRP